MHNHYHTREQRSRFPTLQARTLTANPLPGTAGGMQPTVSPDGSKISYVLGDQLHGPACGSPTGLREGRRLRVEPGWELVRLRW